MIVLNTKTFDELKEEATSDLQAVGFNTSAGSIAKLFMNIVNKNKALTKNVKTTMNIFILGLCIREIKSTTDVEPTTKETISVTKVSHPLYGGLI